LPELLVAPNPTGNASRSRVERGVAPPTAPHKLSRIVSLDAWRGLALILVYAGHCLGIAAAMVEPQTVSAAMRKVGSFGGFGLSFLFVLSGYLITRILLESRGSQHYYKTYFARRILRIFPVYYLFLALTLIAAPALFGRKPVINDFLGITQSPAWLWFYGTNIIQSIKSDWCFGRLIHLWSLSVEEHFYVLWPLIVAFLPGRRVLQLSLSLVTISLIARVVLGFGMHEFIAMRVNTFCNMDCIAAGAALAVLLAMQSKPACARIAKILLAVAAVATPFYAVYSWIHPTLSGVFAPTLGAIGFSGLVLMSVSEPQSCQLIGAKFFKIVGKYSYGLYLFHYPIIYFVSLHCVSASWSPAVLTLALFAISWAIAAPLAILSFHMYETPFLRLKDKFEYMGAK
jgi:peptidoglycan/LPS O-acetylase OafA/YrhL